MARWELSRRLTARRKELGIDVKSITASLGFTRNYWSAVENDRTLIAEEKLRRLFDVLEFAEQDQSELLQLREDSRKRGWWDEYPSLSNEHKRFLGMEAGAVKIRIYGGHLVPGFLQTDDYARAVIASDPGLSPVELDRVAAVRRRRQHQLLTVEPPDLEILLSEAALRQQVAGPEVQARQLRSVARLLANPAINIEFRVLPFSVNPGAIASSPTLVFLEYGRPHLPTTAAQEGVQLFSDFDADDDDDGFRHLEFAWGDAVARALGPVDSMVLLERVAAELEADNGRGS